jgi:hypothetical protein
LVGRSWWLDIFENTHTGFWLMFLACIFFGIVLDGHLRHDCLAAGPMGERACFPADCRQEPLENSFL